VADVFWYHHFVSIDGRDEVFSRPNVLPDKTLLALAIDPDRVDGALALDLPDHQQHRTFRRDRDHHVHTVRRQMTFLNPAFLRATKARKTSPRRWHNSPHCALRRHSEIKAM
jgi:hypothetical protein